MAETKNTKAFYNTEVPEGWELKKVKDILKEGRLGGNYENAEANKGIPVIKMGNIDRGTIKIDKVQYLPEYESYNKEDVLVKGDLLFNTRNTLELVGKVAIWNDELPFAVYNSNLMRMKFNTSIVESSLFMNCAFNSHYGLRQLRGIATGTTSVAAIYGRDLESIKFLLPPLPEQRAIAQVLSTADAAIHTTEKLIAQKELRKKWLMQQLLTGKKRLLNDELGMMNEEWKPIRIGDVFKFIKSYSISREGLQSKGEGSVFCIHYGDIHAKYDSSFLDFNVQRNIPQLIDESLSIEDENYLRDGDMVMADASEDYEGVGAAVEVKNLNGKKAIGGLHTLVLRADRKTISPDFAAYFFASETVRNTLRQYATGTSVYSVTKTQIHNLSFIIPNALKEQTAIAQVLQAADKEVTLLKAKAEKLREQKRGLMQVLLTGKVRLKIH